MIGTKEDFRQEVIQSLHARYPEWKVDPIDELALSITAEGKDGHINLDNLYRQVQLNREDTQTLVSQFLSVFAQIIKGPDGPLDNFDAIKNRLTLVVRPVDLYRESLAGSNDGRIAFCLPLLPDLALYWAVDQDNAWQYITRAQFSQWRRPTAKVMWWAYENTCKAEKYMKTGVIGEEGLLIHTARRNGTISHLLFEPTNLQRMIRLTRPDWPEQPYWVCIPMPNLIIAFQEGHYDIIKKITMVAQEHYGRTLSNRIYKFADGDFVGEVIRQPDRPEPLIMTLEGRIPKLVLPD